MFCHDRYSLFLVFEKKQHDRINTRKEMMKQEEGGERKGSALAPWSQRRMPRQEQR